MTDRIYNFSAGPATLPETVLKTAQPALWSLGDSGIGVLEHSHRSPEFTAIIKGAEERCRKLLGISDDYAVVFLQGGASSQFYMAPMNFLEKSDTADYIHTGTWSKKAITEANKLATVHVAGNGEADSFKKIPSADKVSYSDAPVYVHYTSNNTIAGTQWRTTPTAPKGVPLVVDASSDILSRPIDIAAHGLVYAGAQKNLGPAGVTLAIVRKDMAERASAELPTMLQYRTHIEKGSCFNTPPTFAIFVVGKVLEWLEDFGGLEAMDQYNRAKAKVIYDHIDNSSMFRCEVAGDSRSLMNITFRATTPELEAKFIADAKGAGLAGLKGHRSVGGMRASVYNAFPAEGCDKLVEFMKNFESSNS